MDDSKKELILRTVEKIRQLRDSMVDFLNSGLSDENLQKAEQTGVEFLNFASKISMFYTSAVDHVGQLHSAISTAQNTHDDDTRGGLKIELSRALAVDGTESLFKALELQVLSSKEDEGVRVDTL